MKNKNKLLSIFVVLLLASSSAAVILPASAHVPSWIIPTFAYIAVTPNPVGINQQVFLVMWLDKAPPTAGGIGGDRWENFKVEVTKPDGTKEILGPYTSDSTSSAFTLYTPSQIGTYSFYFSFPGQTLKQINPVTGILGSYSDYINDTFTASSASCSLVVQQQAISEVPSYPLPTQYWIRPIEGQNTNWGAIASNWLGSPYITGSVQPAGAGPETAHVMWTKPFQDGGIVGGVYSIGNVAYYGGLSYETAFGSALIMQGRLYYNLPRSDVSSGNGYVCVDLQTGEQLWWQNTTMPTFAQLYDYESMNQHGVIPSGYMWKSVTDSANGGTVWMAYNSLDGNWLFNLTNVPSGTQLYGINGEIMIYQLNVANRWLALWNNTAAPNLVATPGNTTSAFQWRPVGKNVNASTAYNWNVSIPASIPTGSTILKILPDDMMIGSVNFPAIYSAVGSSFAPPTNTTEVIWAISLKPASRGQLLWQKTFSPPAGNITKGLGPVDTINRVFTMTDKETMQWLGFDLDTGNNLWGPVGQTTAYQYYGSPMFPGQTGLVYQGRLYCAGYGGIVYCYNTKTGALLWTYGNGGEGNSTNCGIDTPWGNYPTFPAAFADGKFYLYSTEHSPNSPLYKGERVRCIDAASGKEIWTLMSWSSSAFAIADGYAIYLNLYDNQIYCIGKGPSATTVEAPLTGIEAGDTITIQGTVTDQTPQIQGSPAMSDESMSDWMGYKVMQKPMPADATGVQVTLTAYNEEGTATEIGTATSDTSGTYAISWDPATPGLYSIVAEFNGNKAYYGSTAETHITVIQAKAQPTETAAPTQTPQPTATRLNSISINYGVTISNHSTKLRHFD